MNVLVDTCIWSEALRKPTASHSATLIAELHRLLEAGRVVILGPIRQEILSGVRNFQHFRLLKAQLRVLEDYPLQMDDFEMAAELFNYCRSKGIQGSNTDFLICAASIRYGLPIFTTDKDFVLFSRHIKIHLHS